MSDFNPNLHKANRQPLNNFKMSKSKKILRKKLQLNERKQLKT